MISAERLRQLLHYDPATGVFTNRVTRGFGAEAGAEAGGITKAKYRQIRLEGRVYLAHRLAWLYVHGRWPSEIDHINRVRGDNRLANLRDCTHQQNVANSTPRKDSFTGFRNIGLTRRGLYLVRFTHNGRRIHVGLFDSLSEAVAARDEQAIKIHGEFAEHLSFVSQEQMA